MFCRATLTIAASLVVLFGTNASAQRPVFRPVGCPDGFCAVTIDSPVQSPIGCGGACRSSPSTDFVEQVRVFGFGLKANVVAESLSTELLNAPRTQEATSAFNLSVGELRSVAAKVDQSHRVCSPRAEAPAGFWREALVQRKALLSCDKAVKPLVELRADDPEYFTFLSGGAVKRGETFKTLLRGYKEACLQPLIDYKDTNPFRALFGSSFSDHLRDNVGTLVGRNGNSGFQCTASLVKLADMPKKLGLLTAAHCIGAARPMGTENSQVVAVFNPLTFTSLNGRNMAVSINPDVRGWMFPTGQDVAIIPATAEAPSDLDGFPLGKPTTLGPFDPLYLVGVNPILSALMKAEGQDNTEGALKAATITLSAPCRVLGIDRGRLVHNCETEKQMSGSPIFTLNGASPAIVAVHTGGDDEARPLEACGSESWAAINQAVLVPSK